ncbi:MAG: hypothetical protein JO171_11070 [Paludibacterium sp.]|uniref:hypothetical protein n=1 Tax=Paludibacterium sp. TaxID=1917523 RepID=UPI0025FA7E49|nr:hypothetical protein [Paludibacterium sp.]MBV8047687.1 hypothetical protein [Paludibacterium sp.]MBV8647090.1 hypothetical protein [Paludibacterium sp.]
MATELALPRLTVLHTRLNRMRHRNPELLLATGLDDWLPLLDSLTAILPPLTDELARAERTLRLIQARLSQAGATPQPADRLLAQLEAPYLTVRQQTERLSAML